MKKNLLFTIIGLIAGTTLTATAAYVYTARDINYQPSDENWSVNNVQEALSELKTDVSSISNKVEGIERIHKVGETELVALVSTNSYYKDANGKYVLSNSDTGRALLADTSTYKSLPSTQDCVGVVGQSTCSDANTTDTSYLFENFKGFVPVDSSGIGNAGTYTNLRLTHDRELLVMESLREGSLSFSVTSSECTITKIFERPNSYATSMFAIYLIEGKTGQEYTAYTSASNGIPILARFALYNNYNFSVAYEGLTKNNNYTLSSSGKALVFLANFNTGNNPSCTSSNAQITSLFGNVNRYCKVYAYYVEGNEGDQIVTDTGSTSWPATVILDVS